METTEIPYYYACCMYAFFYHIGEFVLPPCLATVSRLLNIGLVARIHFCSGTPSPLPVQRR